MKHDDTDFELLPHQELEKLRAENERLRQNPFKGRAEPHDLQGSIDHLTQAITKLTKMFSATNEEMLADYQRGTLQEQIKQISSQNEKIAEGILTIAQMLQPQQAQEMVPQEQSFAPEQEMSQPEEFTQEMNPSMQAPMDQPMNAMPNPQMPPQQVPNQQMAAPQSMPEAPMQSGLEQNMQMPMQAPAMPPPLPPPMEKKKGFGLFKK